MKKMIIALTVAATMMISNVAVFADTVTAKHPITGETKQITKADEYIENYSFNGKWYGWLYWAGSSKEEAIKEAKAYNNRTAYTGMDNNQAIMEIIYEVILKDITTELPIITSGDSNVIAERQARQIMKLMEWFHKNTRYGEVWEAASVGGLGTDYLTSLYLTPEQSAEYDKKITQLLNAKYTNEAARYKAVSEYDKAFVTKVKTATISKLKAYKGKYYGVCGDTAILFNLAAAGLGIDATMVESGFDTNLPHAYNVYRLADNSVWYLDTTQFYFNGRQNVTNSEHPEYKRVIFHPHKSINGDGRYDLNDGPNDGQRLTQETTSKNRTNTYSQIGYPKGSFYDAALNAKYGKMVEDWATVFLNGVGDYGVDYE